MKIIYFIFSLFFVLSQTQCRAQLRSAFNLPDQEIAKVSLHLYKADACLNTLLYAIVDADSNHKTFPPDVYYYLFHFEKATNYNTIVIYPMRWSPSLPNDCSGVIQIDNMSFVCCGDVKNSPLFTDMKVMITKQVSFKKKYSSRDEERDKKLRDWEHSPTALIGSYNVCQGNPIDLHVNVGRKIGSVGNKK